MRSIASAIWLPAAPELPAVAESGVRDFDISTWYGVRAPAATPKDIVLMGHAALSRTLRAKATQDSFTRLDAETLESTPEEFTRFMRDDLAKWTKVIDASGIKLE
ncbi:MAG: hypothetical protein HYU73_16770 [Betaproteobacteria bacterium]|nr:hypothetical protein [Betaproteobacteria bacterium]MBI3052855.1 hypothetical protein [Betaproteobacteria bacterium]